MWYNKNNSIKSVKIVGKAMPRIIKKTKNDKAGAPSAQQKPEKKAGD